jgi:hypothetical protein
MKILYWITLITAWILLTPAVIVSIPGWILWVIAKTIAPTPQILTKDEDSNRYYKLK